MQQSNLTSFKQFSYRRWLTLALVVIICTQAASCAFFGGNEEKDDLPATITALQATLDAPTATPEPSPTPIPPTLPPPPTPVPPTLPPVPTPIQSTRVSPADLESRILSSQVLLFENIAGNDEVFRYVKAAMNRLGFREGSYMDIGDAQGRLKQNMLSGAPNGKPWDLIIIAAEDRAGVQGELFELLEDVLQKGSSVILEAWYLDYIKEGTIKPIMLRCGVDVQPWVSMSGELALYPVLPDHPLLNEVVRVGSFRVANYWLFPDQGDLLFITGTGDAKIVVSAAPNEPNGYGVLTECMNGRLILQTFSSHNYMDDTSVSLWANYIHYALRRRIE